RSYGDWSSDVCSSDLEAKIPPPHRYGLGARLVRRADRAAVGRGDAVDAIIHTPLQAVDQGLHVVDDEAGVVLAADVGLAVAVGEIGRASCRERDECGG